MGRNRGGRNRGSDRGGNSGRDNGSGDKIDVAAQGKLAELVEGAGGFKRGSNGTYEPGGKHKPEETTSRRGGTNSAEPKNGQAALDNSHQIKETSPRRIGVDKENGEYVVLDQTHPGKDIYHGHVRPWDELTDAMQNVLVRNGHANRRGKILGTS